MCVGRRGRRRGRGLDVRGQWAVTLLNSVSRRVNGARTHLFRQVAQRREGVEVHGYEAIEELPIVNGARTCPDKLHSAAAHLAIVLTDGCPCARRMIATTAPLATA